MIKRLGFMAIGALLVYAFIGVLDGYLNLPVAQFSNSSKECVEVVRGDYTCESLPNKYLTEWVQ